MQNGLADGMDLMDPGGVVVEFLSYGGVAVLLIWGA